MSKCENCDNCKQGRNCPARQACELPEVTAEMVWNSVFGFFTAVGLFAFVILLCCAWGYYS